MGNRNPERALIFLGGENVPFPLWEHLLESSFLIACDSGAQAFLSLEIRPDVIIGDMDSIGQSLLDRFKDVPKLIYPRQKDKTDAELGMDFALEHAVKEIVFIGGLGGRLDHSLANILLLLKLQDHKASGYILSQEAKVYLLPQELSIRGKKGQIFSLIPLSKTEGVTIEGGYYPLKEATLLPGSTLGLSNYFEEEMLNLKKTRGLILMVLLNKFIAQDT